MYLYITFCCSSCRMYFRLMLQLFYCYIIGELLGMQSDFVRLFDGSLSITIFIGSTYKNICASIL